MPKPIIYWSCPCCCMHLAWPHESMDGLNSNDVSCPFKHRPSSDIWNVLYSHHPRFCTTFANVLCECNMLMYYAPYSMNMLCTEIYATCYVPDLDLQMCYATNLTHLNLIMHTTISYNRAYNEVVFLSKDVMPRFCILVQTSSCFVPTLTWSISCALSIYDPTPFDCLMVVDVMLWVLLRLMIMLFLLPFILV